MDEKFLRIIILDGSFKTTPFINRLARGLSKNHQVYILGFNEKITSKIKNVHYLSLGSNQNKISFLNTTLRFAINSKNSFRFIDTLNLLVKGKRQALQERNFGQALAQIAPDIIHLQWPSMIPWVEGILTSQKTPVILSQRGFHSNVRPFVDQENFEYLKKWFPRIAGFHSVSKAISGNGDKIWHSSNKMDQVIYTGLSMEAFNFKENYHFSSPIQLLSVGRAHWKKGYHYALQSCAVLKQKGIPFEYTIVGGADSEELQFMVSDLGLTDSVFLKGKITQQEVFQLMGTSSVLLMSSTEEGIANVVVEAMALGLPVISTDCGGMCEAIEHSKEGWIVPLRSPKAIADAIIAFINTPLSEIEKVRLAARKKVEVQHTAELMVEEMENLYKTVILNFKK